MNTNQIYFSVSILGLKFFETSAKDNINVKSVFEQLVDKILEKMSEGVDQDGTMTGGVPGGRHFNPLHTIDCQI